MKLRYQLLFCLSMVLVYSMSFGQPPVKKTLAFFIGHSQWNKGSQGKGLPHEWDYCNAIGSEIVRLAPQYGINVKLFYRGAGGYTHAVNRMHEAKNQWSPLAPVISCHYNETPRDLKDVQKNASRLIVLFANGSSPSKGSLLGTLILYKPVPETQQVASCLLQNVATIMQRPATGKFVNVSGLIPMDPTDRGASEVLSPVTKTSVVLLEIGYGDNEIDMEIMSAPDFKTKLANAILKTYQNNQCNPQADSP